MSKHDNNIKQTKKRKGSHFWIKTKVSERSFKFRPKKLSCICDHLCEESRSKNVPKAKCGHSAAS